MVGKYENGPSDQRQAPFHFIIMNTEQVHFNLLDAGPACLLHDYCKECDAVPQQAEQSFNMFIRFSEISNKEATTSVQPETTGFMGNVVSLWRVMNVKEASGGRLPADSYRSHTKEYMRVHFPLVLQRL